MEPKIDRPVTQAEIDRVVDNDIYYQKHEKFSTYKGEKCMACEAGELNDKDICENCGCFAAAEQMEFGEE